MTYSEGCIVCGSGCGPLRGPSKSWRCAGLLAASVKRAREIGRRMDTGSKDEIRSLMLDHARRHRATRILDLWGGGESARLFAQELPDAVVISSESERALWPALRADAASHGYIAHCGDVADAPGGPFDFAWLDFCGQMSERNDRAIIAVRDCLTPGGSLGVTVMPARESYGVVAHGRKATVPAALVSLSQRGLTMLREYHRPNGQRMFAAILEGPPVPLDVRQIAKEMEERGYYSVWSVKPGKRGSGSVFRRGDGQWVGALSVGVSGGKRRRIARYGATREEAERRLAELREELATPAEHLEEADESWTRFLRHAANLFDPPTP